MSLSSLPPSYQRLGDTSYLNPVTRQVSRTFEDINGINHASYADAYKASVKAKLSQIIFQETVTLSSGAAQRLADSIMKEMVVAWG